MLCRLLVLSKFIENRRIDVRIFQISMARRERVRILLIFDLVLRLSLGNLNPNHQPLLRSAHDPLTKRFKGRFSTAGTKPSQSLDTNSHLQVGDTDAQRNWKNKNGRGSRWSRLKKGEGMMACRNRKWHPAVNQKFRLFPRAMNYNFHFHSERNNEYSSPGNTFLFDKCASILCFSCRKSRRSSGEGREKNRKWEALNLSWRVFFPFFSFSLFLFRLWLFSLWFDGWGEAGFRLPQTFTFGLG